MAANGLGIILFRYADWLHESSSTANRTNGWFVDEKRMSKEGQNLNFAIAAETVRDAIAKSAIVAPVPTPLAAVTPTPSVAASAANDYFHRAVQEETNGNHQGAIADFTEGIRLQPDNSLAYVLRGETYNSLQQYDKAISDFTESIRLNPNAGPTYPDLQGLSTVLPNGYLTYLQNVEQSRHRHPMIYLALKRSRDRLMRQADNKRRLGIL